MGLVLITAPAIEPVTTAEMKTHLRVDNTAEDVFIDTLVQTARKSVEQFTLRALITQTWDVWMDTIPTLPVLLIPKPPLQSITNIKYYDDVDAEFVFGTVNYRVDTFDSQGGRVALTSGSGWPSGLRYINGLVVRLVAGYGATAASVPEPIRHAIKLLVAHWFENREPVNIGNINTDLPLMIQHLLWPYRVIKI